MFARYARRVGLVGKREREREHRDEYTAQRGIWQQSRDPIYFLIERGVSYRFLQIIQVYNVT
jgi:hypothetical protein